MKLLKIDAYDTGKVGFYECYLYFDNAPFSELYVDISKSLIDNPENFPGVEVTIN